MDIDKFIDKIIPYPANYETRNGFNNQPYLKKLKYQEKIEVGNKLIKKIAEHPDDMLIIDSLAYLTFIPAVPAIEKLFINSSEPMIRVEIASSIFEINQDDNLIAGIISDFRKIEDPKESYYTYKLTKAFYYLHKIGTDEIKKLIEEYINHKDGSVSYNAKLYLEILSTKKQKNRWWQKIFKKESLG